MKIYDAEDDFGKLSRRYYTAAYPYYTRLTSSDFFYGQDWKDYIEIDTAFESKVFWIREPYYKSMGFFFCYKRESMFEWQTKKVYLGVRENIKRVLQPINIRKVSCTSTF